MGRGVRAAQPGSEVDARHDPKVIAGAHTGIRNSRGPGSGPGARRWTG